MSETTKETKRETKREFYQRYLREINQVWDTTDKVMSEELESLFGKDAGTERYNRENYKKENNPFLHEIGELFINLGRVQYEIHNLVKEYKEGRA